MASKKKSRLRTRKGSLRDAAERIAALLPPLMMLASMAVENDISPRQVTLLLRAAMKRAKLDTSHGCKP